MSPRMALSLAADVAVFLWHLLLLCVACMAFGWASWQVHLAVMYSGGSKAEQAWALFGCLAVALTVLLVAAVVMSGKWEKRFKQRLAQVRRGDRVRVKTR